jgi:hypothetical protein
MSGKWVRPAGVGRTILGAPCPAKKRIAFRLINVFTSTKARRSRAIPCAYSRTAPVSTRRPCRRWRASSTCPRPLSSCPPRAATRPCAFSRRAMRCRSPAIRRSGPLTFAARSDSAAMRCVWTCRRASSRSPPRTIAGPSPRRARRFAKWTCRARLADALGLAESRHGRAPALGQGGQGAAHRAVALARSRAPRRAPSPMPLPPYAARTASAWPTCSPSGDPADARALLLSERRGDARGSRDRFRDRQFRRLVARDESAAPRCGSRSRRASSWHVPRRFISRSPGAPHPRRRRCDRDR